MRIMNKDRDIFADMMARGESHSEAYGNLYDLYIVGTSCGVDTGLLVSTYNIVKTDGRGCSENTYAVLETPVEDWAQPIAFISGKWAYLDRYDRNIARVWE